MIGLPLALALAAGSLCLLVLTGLAIWQGLSMSEETEFLQARHERLGATLNELQQQPLQKVSLDQLDHLRQQAGQINALYGRPGPSPDLVLARLTEVLHKRVQVVSLTWQQKDGTLALVVEAASEAAIGEVHGLLEQEAVFSSVILARKMAATSARGKSRYEFQLREAGP